MTFSRFNRQMAYTFYISIGNPSYMPIGNPRSRPRGGKYDNLIPSRELAHLAERSPASREQLVEELVRIPSTRSSAAPPPARHGARWSAYTRRGTYALVISSI